MRWQRKQLLPLLVAAVFHSAQAAEGQGGPVCTNDRRDPPNQNQQTQAFYSGNTQLLGGTVTFVRADQAEGVELTSLVTEE